MSTPRSRRPKGPAKPTEFDQADAAAKALLGDYGRAYFDTKAPRADKYQIRWTVPQAKAAGTIGSGASWAEALADAESRWAKWQETKADAAQEAP